MTDLGWLTRDVIAGLTVGMVVVPQGMSYAQVRHLILSEACKFNVMQLATLPPEYGLYSSFVGVLIYCVCTSSGLV